MRQMVVNKYEQVYMQFGSLQNPSSMGVYQSVQEALNAMSRLYWGTTWESRPEEVRVYGVITESNGYQHCTMHPIFKGSTSQFWRGRQPSITEIRK